MTNQIETRSNKDLTQTSQIFRGMFDYAGLFPPAKLSMQAAVQNYAGYLSSPTATCLGKFIVPANQLESLANEVLKSPTDSATWSVSVIVGDWQSDKPIIDAWQAAHKDRFQVDSIECQYKTLDPVGAKEFTAYVEVPMATDEYETQISKLAELGLNGKIRCGGLDAKAFPTPADLAAVIACFVRNAVAFKATAGLHHMFAGARPAYDSLDAPSVPMLGFLSLCMATAFLKTHPDDITTATRILEDSNPENFTIDGTTARWLETEYPVAELTEIRRNTFHSVGSCSFEEPTQELAEAGLI